MSAAYPPDPWRLRGDLHASVFLVPIEEVRTDLRSGRSRELPPGWRPVRLGRYGVVTTAWVSYRPGGVLAYDELMATVLVRRGRQLLPSITHIWVDSEVSRDGGRALWGIPKELAHFAIVGARFGAHDDHGPIAAGSSTPRMSLPWRLPCRFQVAQSLDGAAAVTPVRVRARVSLSRATFVADPNGPLAWLADRRPWVSLTLREFRMTFGHR